MFLERGRELAATGAGSLGLCQISRGQKRRGFDFAFGGAAIVGLLCVLLASLVAYSLCYARCYFVQSTETMANLPSAGRAARASVVFRLLDALLLFEERVPARLLSIRLSDDLSE